MSLPNAVDTPCELWTGRLTAKGYGDCEYRGVHTRAHRMVWIKAHGEISPGLTVDHICRVRACINLSHLRLATMKEQMANRETYQAKKTHCPLGHLLDARNNRGARFCRECGREACRRWRAKRAA